LNPLILFKEAGAVVKFLLTFFSFFCCALTVYSVELLPVASNLWFVGEYSSYRDSCENFVYSYKKTDASPEDLARSALVQPPDRENCHWTDVREVGPSTDQPETFPGTSSDWKKITLDSSSVLPIKYERICLNGTGQEIDSISTIISPIYICPVKSRQTDEGCSTSPNVCEGDVVGRDLRSSLFPFLGHVGLTDSPSNILEMLNASPSGLFLNSFDSFFNASPGSFWGEVYSPMIHQKMTFDDGSSVINAGMSQLMFSPQYTYLPLASPGQTLMGYIFDQKNERFIQETIFIPAVFRCDTFVDFSYKTALGSSLLDPWMLMMPKTIYDSFSAKRDAFPNGSSFSKIFKQGAPASFSDNCENVQCFQEEIDELLKSSQLDPNLLHEAIQGYIQSVNDPKVSNGYLYQQAMSYQSSDSLRYELLLQELQEPFGLSLISSLVDQYQHDRQKRSSSLNGHSSPEFSPRESADLYAISDGIRLTRIDQVQALSSSDREIIQKTQDLFRNIMLDSQNMDEVTLAFSLAQNVLPESEIEELMQKRFPSTFQLTADSLSSPISMVQTRLIWGNFLSGKAKVSLSSVEKEISENTLRRLIFSTVSSNSLDFLKNSVRLSLADYIANAPPSCVSTSASEHLSGGSSDSCVKSLLLWLHTNERFFHISPDEQVSFDIKKLLKIQNVDLIASVLLSKDPKKYKSVNPELIQQLKGHLESGLAGRRQNDLIQLAIHNLGESINNPPKTPSEQL
jgi:hypothetical protein